MWQDQQSDDPKAIFQGLIGFLLCLLLFRIGFLLIYESVVEEKIGNENEHYLWQKLPPEDASLCIWPELIQDESHEDGVVELVCSLPEELGDRNEILSVAKEPSHIKNADLYKLF